MAYITQAGVSLGLAKQVAVEFPEWGTDFATMIVSVIVLNQIIGPLFFKWAIHLAGEAHMRAKAPDFEGERNAIILGLERQSIELAHRLDSYGWKVKIAFMRTNLTSSELANADNDIRPINGFSLESLRPLEFEKAKAIIALLPDEENYMICAKAYEYFGTKGIIVRLNNRANFDRFHEMDALIVEPDTAFVSLLDHMVRSSPGSSLLC